MIDTGDNLAGFDAVPPTLRALDPLLDRPGAFVLGQQRLLRAPAEEPAEVLLDRTTSACTATKLPWRDLRDGMADRGWLDLTNAARRARRRRTADRASPASTTRTSSCDRYDEVAGPADRDADLRIGLAHSPEPRVLDRFAADGYDLVLCGHTHGGQLRVPVLRRAGHQLRHRPRPGALAAPLGTAAGPRRHLAARLGRPGHQPVRAGAVRLPAGGDAAHADRAGRLTGPPTGRTGPALDSSPAPRGVAQLGSARRSGRRGRRFKSCHPDPPLRGRRWRPLSRSGARAASWPE